MPPMPHTCTIYRETQTTGEVLGDMQLTTAAVASGVSCFIQQGGGGEPFTGDRRTPERFYTVFFPQGTDVRSNDRIQPDTGMPQAGRALIVQSAPDTWTGVYVSVSARLKEGVTADD